MGGWLEVESLEAGKLEQHHKGWICFWIYLSMPDAGSSPPRMITFFEENASREILVQKNVLYNQTEQGVIL